MARLVVECCCGQEYELTPEILQKGCEPHPRADMDCYKCCDCLTSCDGCGKCSGNCSTCDPCKVHRLETVLECEGYDCRGCLVPELQCKKIGRKATGRAHVIRREREE